MPQKKCPFLKWSIPTQMSVLRQKIRIVNFFLNLPNINEIPNKLKKSFQIFKRAHSLSALIKCCLYTHQWSTFCIYLCFLFLSSAGRPIICNIQPIKALLTWLTETEYENHDQQERLNCQIEPFIFNTQDK